MRYLQPRTIAVLFVTVAALAIAAPVSAELIFFAGNRSMSVAGHRFEGDRIIVALRGGGDMTFDRGAVVGIAPDEVPDPEPVTIADGGGPVEPGGQLVGKTAYDPLIAQASSQHRLDARLVKAVIQVESSFEPRARSPRGAMGLMQLMPATAREYKARNPYDPQSNIEAGSKHLRALLDKFELPLALAAYNAGEATVRRFGGIPPFPETQAYVAKILALVK